ERRTKRMRTSMSQFATPSMRRSGGLRTMRGGSAVMSNLMHRSFLFAVKVKDMMHKGVEYASPCTAINTIAKKMRELDIGAFPVAATTSSSAWSTTATLPSAARRTVAKVQGQGHDDVRLLPRQRGFRGCRLHFRRRAREAPAGAQRGGADG